MTSAPPILAIDYGTSNSLIAAATPAGVLPPLAIDSAAHDPTVLRSVMFSPDRSKWFFGESAIREYQQHSAQGRLFRSIKKYLPDKSFTGTAVHGEFKNLPELICLFLRNLREKANEHFGKDCTSVVLGRPALFSQDPEEDQLAQTRLEAAAKLAGFKAIEFLPEPIAAAYEFRHRLEGERNVLIADFGGGTSDFTVMRMSAGDLANNKVLAIGGIAVAGDMFDGSIMKHLVAPYFGSQVVYRLPMGSNDLRLPQTLLKRMCSPAEMALLARTDVLNLLKDAQKWSIKPDDAKRMNRLFVLVEDHLGYAIFRAIERSKIELSDKPASWFEFQYPEIDIREEILSTDFRANSYDLVLDIVKAMDATIQSSGLKYEQIDLVCCTGGTGKLPALRLELEKRLSKEKLREHRHFHSVVGGLAEKALSLAKA